MEFDSLARTNNRNGIEKVRLRRETKIAPCREDSVLQLIGKDADFLNPDIVWLEMTGIEFVDCI
jgi:hypothetical protein